MINIIDGCTFKIRKEIPPLGKLPQQGKRYSRTVDKRDGMIEDAEKLVISAPETEQEKILM